MANQIELDGALKFLQLFAAFITTWGGNPVPAVMPFSRPAGILKVKGDVLERETVVEFEALVSKSTNVFDGVYARAALEWAALCDASHPATNGQEDLYEPLLDLVVGRVFAAIRKGAWQVGDNAFPLSGWLGRYALPVAH